MEAFCDLEVRIPACVPGWVAEMSMLWVRGRQRTQRTRHNVPGLN